MTANTAVDLDLLRRFEPVIRYTRGERFFPLDVERFINECSLWVARPGQADERLVKQGQLTLNQLIQPRQGDFRAIYYLKLIEPLDLLDLAKYSLDQARKSLQQAVQSLQGHEMNNAFRLGQGRLTHVGFGSRFIDSLFSFSLLSRGRVPGDTAAAAALMYRKLMLEKESYCYYGRVVRENGWVILQYWFFYLFNNWRSGFFGANDHEGDWEMITIYCTEDDDPTQPPECRLQPHWVAYAAHDLEGDDLRRHWDDPELEKFGDHPVVYAGAGSHATYFAPGEYLFEFEVPFLRPLFRTMDAIRHVWVHWLRQGNGYYDQADERSYVFRVPFIDYARGDGVQIGPGQKRQWEAHLLGPHTAWAMEYRGLWGWYASDPISGENAPAGPVYNRDGSVRRRWYDPLGWAGLDKVAPPGEALPVLYKERQQTQARRDELKRQIAVKSAELVGLGVQKDALAGQPHLEDLYVDTKHEIARLSAEVTELRRLYTWEQDRLEAFEHYAQRLQRGDHGPLRAHIHRAHQPIPELDLRLGWLAEAFAAVSVGVLMIGIVLIVVFGHSYLMFGLAALIGILLFLEAGFRRRLTDAISSVVIGLAVVASFVLLFEFFWQIVAGLVLLFGFYVLWDNVRELFAWRSLGETSAPPEQAEDQQRRRMSG